MQGEGLDVPTDVVYSDRFRILNMCNRKDNSNGRLEVYDLFVARVGKGDSFLFFFAFEQMLWENRKC